MNQPAVCFARTSLVFPEKRGGGVWVFHFVDVCWVTFSHITTFFFYAFPLKSESTIKKKLKIFWGRVYSSLNSGSSDNTTCKAAAYTCLLARCLGQIQSVGHHIECLTFAPVKLQCCSCKKCLQQNTKCGFAPGDSLLGRRLSISGV